MKYIFNQIVLADGLDGGYEGGKTQKHFLNSGPGKIAGYRVSLTEMGKTGEQVNLGQEINSSVSVM